MDSDNMTDAEKVLRIQEIYRSLSDEGKDSFIQNLVEDEELMARLLDALLEMSDGNSGDSDQDSSFISFLRKVRE